MEINIPQEVMDKVMFWVNHKDMEVSGFGKVVYDKKAKSFTVVDAYLLKQEGGAAHTDIDDASLAKLMYTAREVEGDLAWWWHSHVKMDVFWSSTDRATITDLGKQGWIVASVFNQREEVRSALCYQTKVKIASDFGGEEEKTSTCMMDDIKTFIVNARDEDPRHKVWAAEYESNVTEEKYASRGGWIGEYGLGAPGHTERVEGNIHVGDNILTPAEWDTYSKSKHSTVAVWRKENPAKSVTLAPVTTLIKPKGSLGKGDDKAWAHCPICKQLWRGCDCDEEDYTMYWEKSDAMKDFTDDAEEAEITLEDDGIPTNVISIKDPGLMGFGIREEAKVLKLSPYNYLEILNDKSGRKEHDLLIRKLEDKLDEAVRAGVLIEQY